MNKKQLAGEAAAEYVKDGMRLGLGTGSTVYWAIRKLGERVKTGLNVRCAATSRNTEQLARELGIPLFDPDDLPELDLAIDGADEVDNRLNLIKGGGGALLREKIVASAARQFLVVVDDGKCVPTLGAFPLPVEVVPFGWNAVRKRIAELGCTPVLRTKDGNPFVTDNGNYILDCSFGTIPDPSPLSESLHRIPGIVEHGLFVAMADYVIVGAEDGVEVRETPRT